MTEQTHESLVVGYVHTPEGEAALSFAIDQARRTRARITVVHAMTRAPANAAADVDFYEQEIEGVARILENEGIEHEIVQSDDRTGSAAILRAAEASDADMIVIGVRNRSRLGKLILGSDAQAVILEAGCPVVAVKGRRPDEAA